MTVSLSSSIKGNPDLGELLEEKSRKLLRDNAHFVEHLDEISGILSRLNLSSSPILHAIDQKGQDFGTYYFAAYSDGKNLEQSIAIYETIKSLVRYILLMDRHYEVGEKRYARIARGILRSVKENNSTHVRYVIEYSMRKFWPFWKFEQLMKRRMIAGQVFTANEIRYHNLFKSSDASVIYSAILESELPNFDQNVANVLHYNQALQDIYDDFEDIREDVLECMPNVFVLAALEHVQFTKLTRYGIADARKTILNCGSVDTIVPIIVGYQRSIDGIILPKQYAFLKHLSRHYIKQLQKALKPYAQINLMT